MEKLIFKLYTFRSVIGCVYKVTNPVTFRPTKEQDDFIEKYRLEHNLKSRGASVKHIIEAFQSKPKASHSPFSLNSTVWLLCWKHDKITKYKNCMGCSNRERLDCRPYQLLKKLLEANR